MINLIISPNKPLLTAACFLLLILPGLRGQEDFYADKIYKPNIKSVQLYRTGWDLSYPIIEMNSQDRISLSFDELTDQIKNYSYTIEHCDADWYSSGLAVEEYMSGFAQQPIHDYSLSFNTYVNYVHYRVSLPNEDVNILLSGNYIIKVFEDYDEKMNKK